MQGPSRSSFPSRRAGGPSEAHCPQQGHSHGLLYFNWRWVLGGRSPCTPESAEPPSLKHPWLLLTTLPAALARAGPV